jgi:hypothetical protein
VECLPTSATAANGAKAQHGATIVMIATRVDIRLLVTIVGVMIARLQGRAYLVQAANIRVVGASAGAKLVIRASSVDQAARGVTCALLVISNTTVGVVLAIHVPPESTRITHKRQAVSIVLLGPMVLLIPDMIALHAPQASLASPQVVPPAQIAIRGTSAYHAARSVPSALLVISNPPVEVVPAMYAL